MVAYGHPAQEKNKTRHLALAATLSLEHLGMGWAFSLGISCSSVRRRQQMHWHDDYLSQGTGFGIQQVPNKFLSLPWLPELAVDN